MKISINCYDNQGNFLCEIRNDEDYGWVVDVEPSEIVIEGYEIGKINKIVEKLMNGEII